jgi:hypothetical protein
MRYPVIITFLLCLTFQLQAAHYQSLWQELKTGPADLAPSRSPDRFKVYLLREESLKALLQQAPPGSNHAIAISLPDPDGNMRTFRVWETPVMAPELSAKYPQIKTYTATDIDNPRISAKLNYSPWGFHAIIFDGDNTYLIDPFSNESNSYYLAYYKRDYRRGEAELMHCEMQVGDHDPSPSHRTHGDVKRTYRLALACTGEYAAAVAGPTPSKPAVMARMVVSINRVNGVFERELATTLQLVANTDTLIFLDAGTDPYSNTSGSAMMAQNQAVTDSRIGSANYDIGHVFSTGGGGVAQKGSVCDNSQKARGVTGSLNPQGDAFDIDYVAHEMGHQFGADHTFNTNLGACGGGNRTPGSAFEPGSGSTLMAYAGLCGGDNLQGQSSVYFHARSLEQITTYLNTGGTCATTTPANNTPVTLPSFARTYNIPFLTPFELTAPQPVNSSSSSPTWCWEEWDLSNNELTWTSTRLTGPLFRSFPPDTSKTRVFPQLVKLLDNVTSYVGERLPDTARKLHFRLTARQIHDGFGSFNFPDDTVVLNIIRTAMPFSVTNPNSSQINWTGGTTQTVTWQVGGSDLSPVNCDLVDIFLSVDGGYTYPFLLREKAPNTGSATITVPNTRTTANARIKVKGHGNIFFDISNENFSITHNNNLPYPSRVTQRDWTEEVHVFPVPATNVLHVRTAPGRVLSVGLYSMTGQAMWNREIHGEAAIPVSGCAPGVYYLRLADPISGLRDVRPVVLQ